MSDGKTYRIGLFLSGVPTHGGTFQYNLSILHAMAALPPNEFSVVVGYLDKSWQPTVMSLGIDGVLLPYRLIGRLLALAWREFRLPDSWWLNLAPNFNGTIKTMRAAHCDLWVFPSQDCWSYQAGMPALVAILDLMHRYERSFPEVTSWGRFRRLEHHYQSICKHAAGILVDSQVGRKQVMDSYSPCPDRVFVLPFAPPPYLFQDDAKDEILPFDLPAKYLFYPANFWPHKNHDRLLRAIAVLAHELPDIHLLLVGAPKGEYRNTMHLIAELGLNEMVTHLGYVPETMMCTLYRRARGLIMPTFFGPTNIPPLEAMALGCPVAVSNLYAMPEQVMDAGLVFDPESVEDIVRVIRQLWTDDLLCNTLAKRGMEISSQWQQVNFNAKFAEILRQVIGTN